MNVALKVVSAETPDPVEAEFEKDIWNVRNIPGVYYSKSGVGYTLPFTQIPDPFRPVVKRYIKYRLSHWSFSRAVEQLRHLRYFLTFYHDAHPQETGLQNLSRADIEVWLLRVRTTLNQKGKVNSSYFVWMNISAVRLFLEHLQRTPIPEAPTTVVSRLIWPEDGGRKPRWNNPNEIKYIPEGVLLQLDEHLHKMHLDKHIPLVLLLRASGWRISDVLNLRWDTCLEKTTIKGKEGWWLRGDIEKTQVLGHKVPIFDEIAELVRVMVEKVQAEFTETQNPERYLFPSKQESRRGQPINIMCVSNALNRLAKKCNITDDTGKVYHFRSHAFRHTKAVQLINGGMSLTHLQHYMGHKTPEMTSVYGKILDTTSRQVWEKADKDGVVRLDPAGKPDWYDSGQLSDDTDIQWKFIRDNLESTRTESGHCFENQKLGCTRQEIHCYTCPFFATTPAFLPQFYKMREDCLFQIELGEQNGQIQRVAKNRANLEKLNPIIAKLEERKVFHLGGKATREYTPEEYEARKRKRDGN